MIAVFTWIGFICALLAVLSLAYVAIIHLVYFAEYKSNAISRLLRTFWRFYKTLPESKFGHDARFWAVIYDMDSKTFAHAQPLNRELQTESEFEEMREELRRKLTRKRGEENGTS